MRGNVHRLLHTPLLIKITLSRDLRLASKDKRFIFSSTGSMIITFPLGPTNRDHAETVSIFQQPI
jgi:hypothetical protein